MTVAPTTSSPGCFSTGIDSPVRSDWSTAEEPSSTTPSVAIFSPGPHDEAIADRELGDRDAALAAVRVEHGDVLGAELEQRPQRGAGAPLGARLEVAAGRMKVVTTEATSR